LMSRIPGSNRGQLMLYHTFQTMVSVTAVFLRFKVVIQFCKKIGKIWNKKLQFFRHYFAKIFYNKYSYIIYYFILIS
jgi:hypothetical protein